MDVQALKRTQQKLDEKTGGDGYLSQKNLTADGTVVRLLPPSPLLNGLFAFEVHKFWFPKPDGKRQSLIDLSTFGKESVIAEEIALAKMSEDPDVVELASNIDQNTGIKKQSEFWMAVLQLEYKLNRKEEIVGVTVIDDTAKVFQCGSTLLSAMIKVATSRKAMSACKGSEDGIADRELGTNMILSKVGQKLNTKYDAALDETMEMALKYYTEIPDVYTIAKQQMKPKAYQRALIRQYLYGEDIPAKAQALEDARVAELKAQGGRATAKAEAPVKKKKPVTDDDDEDEAPAKKPAAGSAKKKAVVDDDDDEEDAPPVKKKAIKKPVDEDDEDEEEMPVPKSKKGKKPVEDDEDEDIPPAKKKAVASKKSILLPDDDDEDEAPPKKVAKKKAPVDDDDDDEPLPLPKKKVAAKKAVTDDDDDEEEEKPKAKKPANKKVVDDDDDEDEDEISPAKKKAAVPAASGKAKKKTILDDLDDDLDDDE